MRTSQLLTVIWVKSTLNLKSEASTNYLSYLWWFLEPVLQMACYYTVFELLLNRGGPGYIYFLLVGLVPWLWFSRTINQCSNCLISGRGLMSQLAIPKIFFPAVVIVQTTIKQITVVAVFLLFLILSGKQISTSWLGLPFLLVIQILVMVPLAMTAALLVVYVNDLKHLISTAIQFLFFFSGVFFDITNISDQLQNIVLLNPIAGLIQAYRDILLQGKWPDWGYLGFISMFAIVFFSIVTLLYRVKDKRIARVVHE